MKTLLPIYQQLAESLALLFAPMVEVALFNADHELLYLYNRLSNDNLPAAKPHHKINLIINKNQPAKMMLLPLQQNYYLRLIVDTQLFSTLHTFLQCYLKTEEEPAAISHWQQQVDQLIHQQLLQSKTSLTALTNSDKRSIIKSIHEHGLFDYQDASKYLATKLTVSRATIYNYLKQANQLKSLQIHQVDAFTDAPFSGNPGGVVLEANQLDDCMMKKIAREMNLSETAFVLTSNKADIKLRFFTPTGYEVKFCGHSTVGTLYMLAHNKMLGIDKPGRYELRLEANVGIIDAAITLKLDDSIIIQFRTPKVELLASKITHETVAQALGIPLDIIDYTRPVMFEKTNQDLLITINSIDALRNLHIDQKSAKIFAEKNNIIVYALICAETVAKDSHIHARCFAPAVGIAEDPFTGSVLGGLANYVTENHLVDSQLKVIRVEQGHFMSRPGTVELELNRAQKNAAPWVTAKARHFFSTEITL